MWSSWSFEALFTYDHLCPLCLPAACFLIPILFLICTRVIVVSRGWLLTVCFHNLSCLQRANLSSFFFSHSFDLLLHVICWSNFHLPEEQKKNWSSLLYFYRDVCMCLNCANLSHSHSPHPGDERVAREGKPWFRRHEKEILELIPITREKIRWIGSTIFIPEQPARFVKQKL